MKSKIPLSSLALSVYAFPLLPSSHLWNLPRRSLPLCKLQSIYHFNSAIFPHTSVSCFLERNMSSRVSSRLAAKGAGTPAPDKENKSQQLSSTPLRRAPPKGRTSATPKPVANAKSSSAKRTTSSNVVPATPKSTSKPSRPSKKQSKQEEVDVKEEGDETTPPSSKGTKRKRASSAPRVKEEEEEEEEGDELPHNMGKRPAARKVKVEDGADNEVKPPSKKAATPKPARKTERDQDTKDVVQEAKEPPRKKPKNANPYGLTPGETPFPDWPHPTAEECQTVHDLLLNWIEPPSRRQTFGQPDTIPAPSEVVAGCGQVPSILDALIRTLLSAATTGKNSSNSFQGLVKRFGLAKDGLGKGSVNWNAVHEAPLEDVIDAIKSGGLAVSKGKNIKKILAMVHTENQSRLAALTKAKDAGEFANETDKEERAEKEAELLMLQKGYLTLDYYHHLEKNTAMTTFTNYPGIGVKTAACVNMFCMQRPCFAVDTHVFRLCQYLGWVPPEHSRGQGQKKVDRNTCFSHCEVMVPDELKYSLHQLFLAHGKVCPRCRAITGENSEGWADANCPIEHLVKRLGAKKGGVDRAKKKASKGKKGRKGGNSDSEDEEDMSESEGPAPTPRKRNPLGKTTTPTSAKPKRGAKAAKPRPSKAVSKRKSAQVATESEEDGDEDEEMSDLTDVPESDNNDEDDD